ncbi:LacI family DNA-binding transcriptional regulator [Alkalihalobacillus pseudalcaliphilus]|uniref:LacI family DNA-binding transcriptional regulator n=1 Tax=Alkalihalobacillus pseudalcaliphilus TaxID=79884 RepID=UPI00064E0D3E|nr:LacI family DNA-binding transcriptional regulator [Alkalihalobacillus pseudalcaliphilus]KMK74817.1 LacI family transcriptional regulator [Alkalihalobacillus pseudalcaliphilus]
MAKIKDIAEQSGFSISTISRVLNNDASLSVSDETRETIYEIADKLNYRKKMVRPRVKNIALLYWLSDIEELEDVYFKTMRLEVEELAKQFNVELSIYKKTGGIEQIPSTIEGFIAIGTFSNDEVEVLRSITLKGVFIDAIEEVRGYDFVRADLEQITIQAVDYFLEQGHRSIGFIGGTYYNPNNKRDEMDIREKAFRRYLKEKEILDENMIYQNRGFSVSNGYQLMLNAIEQLGEQLPSAFFIAADPIAVGCLQALNEKGVQIPNRVSIISVNNISVSKYVSPPLSTFHIDLKEICRNALEMLLEQLLNKRQITKKVYIGSELIKRRSTT